VMMKIEALIKFGEKETLVSGKHVSIIPKTQCFDGIERFSIRLELTSASEKRWFFDTF